MGRNPLRLYHPQDRPPGRQRGRNHQLLPRTSGRLQGAAHGGVHPAAENQHRQDPEVRSARHGQGALSAQPQHLRHVPGARSKRARPRCAPRLVGELLHPQQKPGNPHELNCAVPRPELRSHSQQSQIPAIGAPPLAAVLVAECRSAGHLLQLHAGGSVCPAVAARAAEPGRHALGRHPGGCVHHRGVLAAYRLVRTHRQYRVRRAQRATAGGAEIMRRTLSLSLAALCLAPMAAIAAPLLTAEKQPLNLQAIGMFFVFVLGTLAITWWAARQTKSTADFYTAGGGISGFQNGLAIAGDYMSAATLLGLSSLVFAKGYDGFVYTVAFFVGWPLITFMMAERLRNLGRFTFADIVSYRLDQTQIRTFAAFGSLTVVCCYLVVQMVGAGQLIKLLFGLDYSTAVMVVGALMLVYVIFGGMIATTWVQIIKAVLLLAGGTTLAGLTMAEFGFSFETLAAQAVDAHAIGDKIMSPGSMLP